MSGTVIDQLWVALGVRADGEGLRDVKRQVNEAKESLISAGDAVKTFLAAFAVHEVAKIGSTFEQNSIQIAGFLSALGQSSDFNQGLQDAAGVIQQITKDAARLPGEADEYIEVFKAGFPFVKAAMPGGSLKDMTDFTNQLTAIGKTFGLDAGLIAREFGHMLSAGKGQASLRLPLFRQLMAFMRHVPGQAKLTAESFNAMTAPARLQLLQATFAQLQPMLDASATSFDAMWGAAVSAVKQMTRFATVPLFKAMKQGLDQFNSLFYDADGKLTSFGQSVVDGIGRVVQYLSQFLQMGGHIVAWFVQTKAGAAALKVVVGMLGTALAGLALEKTIGAVTKLVGVFTNLRSLLMGGVFLAIALIAEDLYTFYTGGDSVTGMIVNGLMPALTQMKIAIGAIGAALILAGLAGSPLLAVMLLLGVIGLEIYTLSQHWDEFVGGMKATWEAFVQSIEDGANSIATALGASPIFNANANKEKQLDDKYDQQRAILRARRQPMAGAIPSAEPNDAGAAWYSWSPADTYQPTPMVNTTAPVSHSTVNHNHFEIKSTDPAAAGKEVARELARNAQSKVKM